MQSRVADCKSALRHAWSIITHISRKQTNKRQPPPRVGSCESTLAQQKRNERFLRRMDEKSGCSYLCDPLKAGPLQSLREVAPLLAPGDRTRAVVRTLHGPKPGQAETTAGSMLSGKSKSLHFRRDQTANLVGRLVHFGRFIARLRSQEAPVSSFELRLSSTDRTPINHQSDSIRTTFLPHSLLNQCR